MINRPAPRFTGVRTYKDRLGRFSFRYPTGWAEFTLTEQDGVQYAPRTDDPYTSFSAWPTALDEKVVAEDLDTLRGAVDAGLTRLDDVAVESSYEIVLGNLLKFERVFTFRENGSLRKRKIWLLYVDTWLIVLTWQGSSPEEWEYWLPMANYTFATFDIPQALWFATDRDLTATLPNAPSS
jgi:hypothetical protein